jgi:low temperature requirement protein LtrA
VSTTSSSSRARLTAVLRQEETVKPLELFFDLVFVLAITQCTALMAGQPTGIGVLKGLIMLAILWWAWVGYAWLTSVVDPEEGGVRLVIFGAMAALLVAALCVPRAYGSTSLLFAVAYGAVRAAHIGLFAVASRDDPQLRRSVVGLGAGTAVGVAVLIVGAILGGGLQIAVWGAAVLLDMAEPFLFGAEGWRFEPAHFAERHGLIVIIALGESIVAIGVGAPADVDAGVVTAAVLGTAVAGALWWLYFDVVALAASRRLARAEGRERNEIARDSYSYLHFPMVAGIVLAAFGLKKTLGAVGHELALVPAVGLLGGAACYLLGHVAFRLRNMRSLNKRRLICAAVLIGLIPAALALPALVTLGALAATLAALIAYETWRFGDARARIRGASAG